MALDVPSVFGNLLFGVRHHLSRRFGHPGRFFRQNEPSGSSGFSRRQSMSVALVQETTIKMKSCRLSDAWPLARDHAILSLACGLRGAHSQNPG